MPFVDFAELKARTTFEQVIKLLDLKLKRSGAQWRGACPKCKSGGDRALVVTEGRGYFCFAEKRGGDQIALAAHVLDISVKDAAQVLEKRIGSGTASQTVPEEKVSEGKTLTPLTYLEHDHDAVVAIGFDPDTAKALGIGYAPKGLMRGTIAIPVRDD